MPPKVAKNLPFEVLKAVAKRDLYFEEIQYLYKLSLSIDDSGAREAFTSLYHLHDERREKFQKYLEMVHDLEVQISPDHIPDYALLKEVERFRRSIASAAHRLGLSKNSDQPSTSTNTKFKLPAIPLPDFYGDVSQWPLFYEKFKTLIHENSNLDVPSKLHYLLGALKGDALEVCAGFTPTPDNYQILVDALKKNFEDKRTLADHYFRQMMDLKPLVQESPTDLRQTILHFNTAYQSLQQLSLPNLADFFATNLLLSKIDPQTRREFETSKHEKIPSYAQLLEFLHEHAKALKNVPNSNPEPQKSKPRSAASNFSGNKYSAVKTFLTQVPSTERANVNHMSKGSFKCPICSQLHSPFQCNEFTKLSPSERIQLVQKKELCFNCFSKRHLLRDCPSKFLCRICQKNHHTLLHIDSPPSQTFLTTQESGVNPPASQPTCNFFTNSQTQPFPSHKITILPTATVVIEGPYGEQKARFLIDSGSQSHFITRSCCQKLKLPIQNKSVPLEGMGKTPLQAFGQTSFNIKSQYDPNSKFNITALITNVITNQLPQEEVDLKELQFLRHVQLADTQFYRPGPIDGILGAQIFSQIFKGHTLVGPQQSVQGIQTSFGFIVLGEARKYFNPNFHNHTLMSQSVKNFCIFNNQDLTLAVQRFWELEEVPKTPKLTEEEAHCETLFTHSTSRNPEGRYCVQLPFKEFPPVLGDSWTMAEKRFASLEKKFLNSPVFKRQYSAVIQDYLQQGHLSPVPPEVARTERANFIPHFAVVKESSSTPLRIVFDASAKTSNGRSLNDTLFTGPKLQRNIIEILTSFRGSAIALIADIRQMYRNIMVDNSCRSFQRIIWRDDPATPLRVYELNCVLFGLTSAPYLALRTVHQLTVDEGPKFPLAAQLVRQNMYVDDLIASVESTPQALEAHRQLVQLFQAGGFKLTKWSSNAPEVLEAIPAEDRQTEPIEFADSSKITVTLKVLGLQWDAKTDLFFFKIPKFCPVFTKRGILSIVARIWDPLGFLAPVTLYAKLIIKEVWEENLDWDDQITPSLQHKWTQFTNQLGRLSAIRIPRYFGLPNQRQSITLIGFADSSEKGYGAVIFARVPSTPPQISFLYAKSRVAPKRAITLPKLELCAAVLLADMMKLVLNAIRPIYTEVVLYACSDSTVTLNWIKNQTRKRETFVAHRVSAIEQVIPPDRWYHIRSEQNVADVISRGLSPEDLARNTAWFHGPSWLKESVTEWPIDEKVGWTPLDNATATSQESPVVMMSTKSSQSELTPFGQMLERFSSWTRLLRVTVYLLRFGKRLPYRPTIEPSDLQKAEFTLIRQVQYEHFAEDLTKLTSNLPCSDRLRPLSPYLEGGIIRVGGRLSHSNLPSASKHPIVLPKQSRISTLIVNDCHSTNFHTGPNLVLSLLRQKYWILSARDLIRKCIKKCNFCFKLRPVPLYPPMANLPAARVQETKPFIHTGVDYAGPFQITISRRRGAKSQKAYLCLFVCLATKAIHLELASSLNTETFLACLKRFLARRGPVSCLYSDRGTNFIGARAELESLYNFLESNDFQHPMRNYLTLRNINWKFNPPLAPHFGGLWESNIRSVKSHLQKVIGHQILSYEEFTTVLTQIEALLNSRPLVLLSSDPAEPEALTPAHFLTLTPLQSLPLSDEGGAPKLHARKELLDSLVRGFWKRWHREYLTSLQPRPKWNQPSTPIAVGSVVVIKEDNTPPLSWPLGVVTNVHPGADGVSRVATVKVGRTLYQRPVVRLCPLPTQ